MFTGKVLIFVLAVAINEIACEIKEEDNVLVLNKDNFDSAITDNEFILVEFYAPWCGHCKALLPEYNKAAAVLKEKHPHIKLAKVDATEETELGERHNVRGYPTIKFFRRGNSIDYTGDRKSEGIVQWLVKKSGPPANTISSIDELKAFKEENDVAVVGYFDDENSENAKNFFAVALAIDNYPFGIVSDASLFSEAGASDNDVIIHKKSGEGDSKFSDEFTEANLKKFVSIQCLPLVVEFNHETAQKIFGGEIKSHVIFFLSKKAGHYEKIIDLINPVAKQYRQSILFVSINVDHADHERILDYFGLKDSEVPAMRIIKLEEEMVKYKPENDELTGENIKQFVQDYLDNKLKEHLLSQTLPEDWNKGPVTVLVASNFDEVVFDKEKDVLVEFYAPWCGHCKHLAPIFDKLGEAFKSKEDIVIAKIDATANELEHTKIENFPTIKLYTKGDNEVINYNGERSLEGFTKFIETRGQYGSAAPEQKMSKDEDDDAPRKDEL